MQESNLTSAAGVLQSSVLRLLRRSSSWLPPVMLGILYFAYGFSQLHQYGVTWDEPLHRNWGKLFMVFWQTGDRSVLELMPGHGIDYGPLYYAVNYVVSEWLYGHGFLRFVEANHILTVMTASVSVSLTFVIGRMFGGNRTGFIAALAFMFYPQLLAHAQYNPKDIPLMAAVLLTAVVFLAALGRGSKRLLFLSAFLMGGAIAFKVSALLMAPVFGLAYLFWITADERSLPCRGLRNQIFLLSGGVFLFGLGALVFWPDAWGDPMLIPRAVKFFLGSDFWPGQVLFFGREYGGAALPWFYTAFEFFAATPVIVLAAFLIGLFPVCRALLSGSRRTESLLMLLWIFLPLLYSMRPGFVRYDGIRQFFFILPAATVVIAAGTEEALARLCRRFSSAWIIPLLSLAVVAELAHEVAVIHPFEGSYRNEIIRLLYPSGMDHVFEIEYWGPSYRQGMEWLIENAEAHPVICVPTAGVLVEWYPWRDDFTFECGPKTTYVMFFTRYSAAGEFAKLKQPVFTIHRMGADLLDIYKVK